MNWPRWGSQRITYIIHGNSLKFTTQKSTWRPFREAFSIQHEQHLKVQRPWPIYLNESISSFTHQEMPRAEGWHPPRVPRDDECQLLQSCCWSSYTCMEVLQSLPKTWTSNPSPYSKLSFSTLWLYCNFTSSLIGETLGRIGYCRYWCLIFRMNISSCVSATCDIYTYIHIPHVLRLCLSGGFTILFIRRCIAWTRVWAIGLVRCEIQK